MNDEKPIRLHPRRSRPQDEGESKAWAKSFKSLIHIVRMTSTRTAAGRAGKGRTPRAQRSYRQRCAVRITYSGNRVRGQWAAHGRYLMRESAREGPEGELGRAYGPSGPITDLPAKLREWQSARDSRLFKLIVSPEFGDRIGLEQLVRELMRRMEADLGRKLEWAAVNHHNTEHPHTHIVLRGMAEGQELRIDRDYIRNGVRGRAEDVCTEHLGFRTPADLAIARERDIDQPRFTGLDRQIASQRPERAGARFRLVVRGSDQGGIGRRLFTLQQLGLARPIAQTEWEVQSDFDLVLRTMQAMTDRQRMIASYADRLSSPHLPVQYTPPSQITELRGRVIAHRLDDVSGRVLMVFEGTDRLVHLVPHNPGIERARAGGRLSPGHFAVITNSGSGLHVSEDVHVDPYFATSRLGDRSRSGPLDHERPPGQQPNGRRGSTVRKRSLG